VAARGDPNLRDPPAAASFRYAGRQHWDAIAKGLRPVYTAPTEQAAQARFDEFTQAWGDKYPAIIRLWNKRLGGVRALPGLRR
jgi:transposase-like protein